MLQHVWLIVVSVQKLHEIWNISLTRMVIVQQDDAGFILNPERPVVLVPRQIINF